jgi:hypothetical protein
MANSSATRQQRRASRQHPKKVNRSGFWFAAGLVLIVAAGVVAIALNRPTERAAPPSPPPGVEQANNLSREHVEGPLNYPGKNPPMGGAHSPQWQNCGFYDTPINNPNAVHSLEHGAVWITYRPELPADQVEVLRQLARRQTFILVSPYPELSSPVVATAWGHQLKMDSVGDPRLGGFIRTYRVGRTTPEPGAPCTGGVGQPK